MSQRSSTLESDFAKPGAITIKCISNAGHSIVGHKSMGTYPARAIIWCHADSCPSSPPESNNVSSDGIFPCPSVIRIMGIFYHIRQQINGKGLLIPTNDAERIRKVRKYFHGRLLRHHLPFLSCARKVLSRVLKGLLHNVNNDIT